MGRSWAGLGWCCEGLGWSWGGLVWFWGGLGRSWAGPRRSDEDSAGGLGMPGGCLCTFLVWKKHHREAERHESNKMQQQVAKRSKEEHKGNQERTTCQRKAPKFNALPVLAQTGLCWGAFSLCACMCVRIFALLISMFSLLCGLVRSCVVLGRSLGDLGSSWGCLGAVLWRSYGGLGRSWGGLGRSWACMCV